MANKTNTAKIRTFWALYVVIFIFLPVCGLNYAAKRIIEKKSFEKQYILSARASDNKSYFVICHENPTNNHYDMSLSREMRFFRELVIEGEPINTTNKVYCQSYPKDMVEPEDRIKNLPPKKPGVKRLAFVGDSITFGEGVRTGDAFPEKMQTYLDFYGNRDKWQILNLGRMGYDLPDVYSKCFKSALETQPDKIVYVWFPNDMPRDKWGFPEILRQNDMINSLNYYSRHAKKTPLILLIKAKMNEYITTRETIKWIENLNGPNNPEGIKQFRNYLRSMKKEANQAGADFSVALFPIIAGKPGKYPFSNEHAYVMKILAEEKIPAVDLAKDVISTTSKNLIVHPRNHHPNFYAHLLAAKALIADLKLSTTDSINGPSIKEAYKPLRTIPPSIFVGSKGTKESYYAFYFLAVFSILCIIALFLNSGTLFRVLWSENNKVNLTLILLLIFTVVVRIWLSPRTHLVFNDEHCRLRLAEMWMMGNFNANTLNNTPGPIMYYYFFYNLFGLSITAGWIASMTAVIISFVLFCAAVKLLWKNDMLTLLACLFFATFPITIRFSFAQIAENPNLLLQITMFFAIVVSLRKNNLASLFLLVVSASLLMFMRLLNGVFVFYLLCFWAFAKLSDHENNGVHGFIRLKSFAALVLRGLKRPRYNIAFLVILSSFAFYAWFIYASIKKSPYGNHVLDLARSIPSNLTSNFIFMFKNTGVPIIIIVFAIAGVAAMFFQSIVLDRKKSVVLFFSGWIVVYFFLHISSDAGGYDFDKYFDTVRYTMDFMLPLIILSALGAYAFIQYFPEQNRRVIFALVSLYVLFFPALYMRVINYDTPYTQIVKNISSEIGDYPENSVFYTNSFVIHSTIEMDFHQPAIFMKSESEVPTLCPNGKKCVLVIHHTFVEKEENHPERYSKCFSRYIYENSFLYFCPFDATGEQPGSELMSPDINACFF